MAPTRYFRIISFIFIYTTCYYFTLHAQTTDRDSVFHEKENYVNVAYDKQPDWLVTSSISFVEGTKLKKSFASNLGNTLFGRLPGLTVTQGGGEFGEDSPSLFGRGISTFGPGKGPLIIVDGFEGSFYQLVPEEIESVNLLKDASATALYGSRGANGVLLVTTKRGIPNEMKVDINVQAGFQTPSHLPEFLGSYEYAKLYNEGLVNDGFSPMYSQSDLSAYQSGSDPIFHPDVNWYDEVLRKTVPVSNYNINFRGGIAGVRYFVSLNTLLGQGLFKKTEGLSDFTFNPQFIKFNLLANLDIELTKRLTAYVTSSASVTEKEWPGSNSSSSIFNLMASIPPNAFPVYNPNGTYGGNAMYSNPYANLLENGLFQTFSKNYRVSLKLTHQLDMITEGLSVSGAAYINDHSLGYNNRSRSYERFYISKNESGDINYTQYNQNTSLSGSSFVSDQSRNYAFQAMLNYNRTIDRHLVDAILLLNSDNLLLPYTELAYKHNNISGRFTYSFNKKYIGELSVGYMGSENFAKGNRYGLFPSFSAGWIASNEDFLNKSKEINYLKFKASYGLVGNENIGGSRFLFHQTYPGTGNYYFGTSNQSHGSYAEGPIANKNITWEKAKIFNVGVEATLFKQINFSFEFFNHDRYDIIAYPHSTIPQFTGINLNYDNVGKVNNKGFEATLRLDSNPSNEFKYFVESSAWYAKNEIKENSEPLQAYTYLYRKGHPVNQPFMLEAIGFFENAADIANSPIQSFAIVQPGDIKYKDQNGDNIINQNDYYPLGKTGLPELTVGLTTGFSYKGFDLEAFFQGVSGRSVYLSGKYFEAFQNNGKVSPIALGRWTPETAATANYPRLSSSNNLNNFHDSSFWLANGEFIKLRSVEFGYDLPKVIVSKIKMDRVRIYINGTNLFSFDHLKKYNIDPETSITGYPAMRTYTLGTQIKF